MAFFMFDSYQRYLIHLYQFYSLRFLHLRSYSLKLIIKGSIFETIGVHIWNHWCTRSECDFQAGDLEVPACLQPYSNVTLRLDFISLSPLDWHVYFITSTGFKMVKWNTLRLKLYIRQPLCGKIHIFKLFDTQTVCIHLNSTSQRTDLFDIFLWFFS